MKPFTVSQTTVIQALAAGATVTSAAKLAEISRPTIYHWLQDPAFQQAVAYSEQEFALTMHDRIQTLTAKALDKLEALLDDPRSSPNVILKASLAILTRKNWTLPSKSIEECAPAIHAAAERMESSPEIMQEAAAYQHQLTKLYTNSQPVNANQIPRGAPCPCGSGLKYKRCCGHNAPPVLNNKAA
ncbi:MAG: SEC-C domain-containing protein [Acidobacteria bacterium]|nr:SEC-C domain-containing protein [Acidobacteriota bacterium]